MYIHHQTQQEDPITTESIVRKVKRLVCLEGKLPSHTLKWKLRLQW